LEWNANHSGFIGAERSIPAQYFLKYGLLKTKFGTVDRTYEENGAIAFHYNVHHPPTISYLIYLSFLFFGDHEWSARLVPIAANVVTILFFYLFASEFWDKKAALLSTLIMVFSPMFFYVRYFTAVETLFITATCIVLYFYAKWLNTGCDYYLGLSLLSFAVGTLSDWPIYFIAPVVVAHALFFYRQAKVKARRKIVLFVPLAILTFLLYLSYVWIMTGDASGNQGYGDDLVQCSAPFSRWSSSSSSRRRTPLAVA